MNLISIQTPNEPKDIWKVCQIIKLEVNQFKNNGYVHVKGIARTNNVTTAIKINDFNSLLKGEEIKSNGHYFKIKIENEQTKQWMQEAFKI